MNKELVIITGMGAMGLACARRLGSGRQLLLVDNDMDRLNQSVVSLQSEGFTVRGHQLDLGDAASISVLCAGARELGPLRFLVHTAAVSPTQATAERIYQVNLEGTARLIAALADQVNSSTVGVVIASMAAQFIKLSDEQEIQLAESPPERLPKVASEWDNSADSNQAYMVAKRGNQVRVEIESLRWARHGGRLISLSPGIISTAQGRQEMREQPQVAELVADCPMRRIGTPEDIAAAVEWLTHPASSLVCGTDVLIDGGTIAALRWPQGRL